MNRIEAMHAEFGVAPVHQCRDCCNLVKREWSKRYYKCAAYGLSHSLATDWRLSYPACGLFGKDFDETGMRPLGEVLRHRPRTKAVEADGQIGLFEGDECL